MPLKQSITTKTNLYRFTNLLFLAVLLASCGGKSDEKKKDSQPGGMNMPVVIEGLVVKPTSLSQGLEAPGVILPMEETTLSPEVAGRAIIVNLPEGQNVAKGTLLVKIFDGDLVAQLKKLETQLKIAEQTEKRQAELVKINGISQQDYDLSVLQVSTLKADMDVVRVAIGKTELRAPFDGKIGLKQISVGAYLTPTTTVATIRADKQLKLDFSVPEKYAPAMRNGVKVNFVVEGDANTHTATVFATEQSIDLNTRNLKVRALINTQGAALSPGAFAKVKLDLSHKNSALMIPTQAIIPQARDKKVVVSRNGAAEFASVKTGARDAENVEIIEGLQSGDTIVVKGVLFVKPQSPLKFSKVN